MIILDSQKLKDSLISNSGLSRKLQTLMGDYIVMEGYFMREMMEKVHVFSKHFFSCVQTHPE